MSDLSLRDGDLLSDLALAVDENIHEGWLRQREIGNPGDEKRTWRLRCLIERGYVETMQRLSTSDSARTGAGAWAATSPPPRMRGQRVYRITHAGYDALQKDAQQRHEAAIGTSSTSTP